MLTQNMLHLHSLPMALQDVHSQVRLYILARPKPGDGGGGGVSKAILLLMLCLIAAFPLFGNQMYERLGYQWATSLLAFLTVAMMPFPWLFFKYGKTLRKKSKFAAAT